MPYVGQQPLVGEYIKLDSITVTATDTFNLERNGAAFSPATAEQCIVSVNGVTQAPQDAFNISGSQIVFTSTLSASDVIDYILVMGNALSAGVPSDGSVQTSKLANLSVTNAKIANSTIDLTTKVTGTLPTANGGSFSTASFKAVIGSSNLTPSSANPQVYPDVTSSDYGCHNIGSHYSTTTGKFIIPVTGVYFFHTSVLFQSMGAGDQMEVGFYKTDTDGSSNALQFCQGERKDYAANSTSFGDGYMHGEVSTTGYFTAGQAVYANSKRSGSTPVIHAGSNGSGKKFSGFLGYRIS